VSEAATCIFNDVTKGNSVLPNGGVGVGTNSVPCQGGTPNCSATLPSQTGVLVVLPGSTTEAWTVGAGYDMTTGLGSVNVNNLVTQWKTVNRVATTTALTLSKTTGISHGTGESVGVNITVTPTNATGSVSLIAKLADGTTQGLDQFTLASGKVVNATTNSLPGGTYSVTAHYAGDGTNAPSDSNSMAVTVNQESSKTFVVVAAYDAQSGNLIDGNATNLAYGSLYRIRMYVTNSSGLANPTGPPSPLCETINAMTCPTGTIALTGSGQPLDQGTFTLNNNGYTRDLQTTLLAGAHSLVAQYTGDSSYSGSTSDAHALTITPATTTAGVPYIPYSPVIVGTPVSISTTVFTNVYNGAAPTGTVMFLDGATPISGTVSYTPMAGTSSFAAELRAQINATLTTSGMHAITAQYSGDSNYTASTSSADNATVSYPTTMTLSADSTTINYGSNVTVTAKVVSSYKNPPMTGQIQFFVGSESITVSASSLSTDGSGNQVLTATMTMTPKQTFDVVQAGYQGDANFQGSNGLLNIFVNIPDFSLSDNAVVTVTAGQSQTVTMTVTPASSTPSTVAFSEDSTIPPGMSLNFTPSAVNLAGSPATVTVTVSTTGPTGTPATTMTRQVKHAGLLGTYRRNWWSIAIASAFAAIYLLGIPGRRRRYRGAFLAGVLCALSLAMGCGGGGGGTGGGAGGTGGSGAPVPTSMTLATSNAKLAAGGSFTFTVAVNSTKPVTGTVNIFQGPVGLVPASRHPSPSRMAKRVTRSRITMRQARTHSGRNIAAIPTISARKRPARFRKYSQAQPWPHLWARPAACRTKEESRLICNEIRTALKVRKRLKQSFQWGALGGKKIFQNWGDGAVNSMGMREPSALSTGGRTT
jgi:hypothetical protein